MAECISVVWGNKDQVGQVARQIMELKSLYGVLEVALKENTTLSQQYFSDHILEPMAQALLPINDLIEDAISSWLDTAAAIDPSILQLLDVVSMQFLGFYGIEYIRHAPGVHFDPQVMKPAKIAEIAVYELDGKIAKSLQAGFRLNGRRLLRPESVVLYRFVRQESL
jgi:molecular chaperone GrpE (heat shock protein)